jgi:hypothetical protein
MATLGLSDRVVTVCILGLFYTSHDTFGSLTARVLYALACLLKASRQLLLGNGSVNTPVAMQWLSSRHMTAATDIHATTEQLLLSGVLCAARAETI